MKKPLHIIDPDAKEIIEKMPEQIKVLQDGIFMQVWEYYKKGYRNMRDEYISKSEFKRRSNFFVSIMQCTFGVIAFLKEK